MGAELQVVDDFRAAAYLLARGADSAQLVVLDGADERLAIASAHAGIAADRGPLPPRPHDCGKRCLVVLPTYDERDTLAALVRDVRAYLDTDVLIVDDASPDGTGLIADGLADDDPRVHVRHRPAKLGVGTAYREAFVWAAEREYERVFAMDADFSHAPWDLPHLADAALESDLVIGSRYATGGRTIGQGRLRRMLSRAANVYARSVLRSGIRDMTSGFRCYSIAALSRLDLDAVAAHGSGFQIELVHRMVRAELRVREVPIHFTERRVGQSKTDIRVAREALLLVPRLRFRRVRSR